MLVLAELSHLDYVPLISVKLIHGFAFQRQCTPSFDQKCRNQRDWKNLTRITWWEICYHEQYWKTELWRQLYAIYDRTQGFLNYFGDRMHAVNCYLRVAIALTKWQYLACLSTFYLVVISIRLWKFKNALQMFPPYKMWRIPVSLGVPCNVHVIFAGLTSCLKSP